jgi:hypothetical protein
MIFLVLIGLAISIYIFKLINNKNVLRREERHERMKEKQETLLQQLKDSMNKEQKDEVSDTTQDE